MDGWMVGCMKLAFCLLFISLRRSHGVWCWLALSLALRLGLYTVTMCLVFEVSGLF